MEKRISLNGKWNGICLNSDGTQKMQFKGSVPGCVHTDLIGNAIDYDIFYRDNAEKCQWIENMDWEYSRNFTITEIYNNEQLVFEGLDVYCDVFLNDILLGSCNNMFIKHVFDISDKLIIGKNTVKVHFYSPIAAVEGKEVLNGAFTTERLHTRRIQCTYGWDWVGRFVTCGIYRDTYIRIPDGLCTKNVYVYTECIGDTSAQIVFEADFENYDNGGIVNAEIRSPEGNIIYSHNFYINEPELKEYIDIKNPKLWYPHGYGEQPLYTLIVGDKKTKFGIRTVRILQEQDEKGSEYYNKCLEIKQTPSAKEYDHNDEFSGFVLLVNNIPIMCKGANWVPCEPFPSAERNDKITRLLELSKHAGVNMLRIWGGGVFEKTHFYDECDRLGILLTQDFLMACGKYPENYPDFIEQLAKETVYAAITLRNHPSLMWWSGDNENAIFGCDDKEDYKGRTVTHKSIIPVLNRLDPRRRFLLSSPYGGKYYASKTAGTTHNTQYLGYVWDYIEKTDMQDYKEYFKTYSARFIAEEPTLGATFLPSLKKIMTDKDLYDDSEMWLYHTKGNPAMSKEVFDYTLMFASKVFGDFKNGYDRFFKLKYLQYEWMRISFETVRRNKGFCNGIIYWMLNDCWPTAASWSIIDYNCLPKPAYYCFKRCANPIVASITDGEDGYELYISNDSLNNCELKLKLSLVYGNFVKNICEDNVLVEANSTKMVKNLKVTQLFDEQVIVCDVYNSEVKDRAFFKNGALLINKTDAVKVIEQTEESIVVTADSYIHAVELEGEYLFGDNYFSLLPGEVKEVSLRKLSENSELTVTCYTI